MPKRSLIILLYLFISSITGCQTVIVNSKKLENMSPISQYHGQSTGISGYTNNTGTRNWYGNSMIETPIKYRDPCRIKYHPSYSINRWMAVEGRIDNDKSYPIVLDTGASVTLFVNDIHIMENHLTFSPMKSSNNDSAGWGKCYLPKLNIGQITLTNWPCYYREQHAELRLFGLPVAAEKAVIAGLGALSKFKYIMFDSIHEEVELSLVKTFEPENQNSWTKYHFDIEQELSGNVFLYVKIPVSGEETELQLDTGSGKGLSVTEELWVKISQKVPHIRLTKEKDLYPYIGFLACKRGVIPEINIGDRTIKNAGISIFPDNSPVVDRCSGMIGMQYFQDTVLVLDFERNILWIQSTEHKA